jgi:hypothetical protein
MLVSVEEEAAGRAGAAFGLEAVRPLNQAPMPPPPLLLLALLFDLAACAFAMSRSPSVFPFSS